MEFLGTASDYAMAPMQDKMNQLDEAFSEMEAVQGRRMVFYTMPTSVTSSTLRHVQNGVLSAATEGAFKKLKVEMSPSLVTSASSLTPPTNAGGLGASACPPPPPQGVDTELPSRKSNFRSWKQPLPSRTTRTSIAGKNWPGSPAQRGTYSERERTQPIPLKPTLLDQSYPQTENDIPIISEANCITEDSKINAGRQVHGQD
ncbi:uncharacterized protein CEXT_667361 [Caerostris extrusa]|uniref:Uncharacterized protein n=1 Tax=Caerostris extrusa TaxID=172846 RepID=A0AAV4UWK9_CAEEX|nr:uncharacterized protein CEXT_667361 [Caerostris extrusa]